MSMRQRSRRNTGSTARQRCVCRRGYHSRIISKSTPFCFPLGRVNHLLMDDLEPKDERSLAGRIRLVSPLEFTAGRHSAHFFFATLASPCSEVDAGSRSSPRKHSRWNAMLGVP